jgi:hypothetical protein
MSPVDYVAGAIVHLSLQSASVNRNFNVNNPKGYSYYALFAKFRSFGYELTPLPYAEWRARLLQSVDASATSTAAAGETANALFPILSHFSEHWYASSLMCALVVPAQFAHFWLPMDAVCRADGLFKPKCDNRNVLSGLSGSHIALPNIDQVIFVYLSYLIGCKFVQPPGTPAPPLP